MSEAARFFRYSVPGGLFELIVGFGLLFDPNPFVDLREFFSFDGGSGTAALIALLIASAFPLGFLISNATNAYRWGLRFAPRGPWYWLELGRLLPRFAWPEPAAKLSTHAPTRDDPASHLANSASMTLENDRTFSKPGSELMQTRYLAWLDLLQALAQAAMAVVLGVFVLISFLIVQGALALYDAVAHGGGIADVLPSSTADLYESSYRLAFYIVLTGIAYLMATSLALGQRRVTRLFTVYVNTYRHDSNA